MKHRYRKNGLLALLLLLISPALLAQSSSEKNITGTFSNMGFADFVQQVEQQSDWRFYFDKQQTDSLLINPGAVNEPLPGLLKKVLQGTEMRYAIAPGQTVFITHSRAIQTSLPPGFFSQDSASQQTNAPEKEIVIDFYEEQQRTASAEAARLYEVGNKTIRITPGMSRLTGRITDADTGEPVVGAAVQVAGTTTGITTDPLGYYAITLPRGRQKLEISSLGMRKTERNIILYGDGQLHVEMIESVQSLKEVVVEAERDANVAQPQMGIEKMDIKTIKQMPGALGEADILRVVLTLPGVTSVGEASTGFNVRGGTADQNLILLNNAVIYNPSHLFGFFSAFNPDVLNSVELYKSSIPAQYGGRLSSVLDITTREGNKKKFVASGGIGPITGRLTLEGPLVKDKSSFILGGRANYSNWLLRRLDNENFNNSTASFYDFNLGINHEFDERNSLYVSGYLSQDGFNLRQDTAFDYSNRNASVKWTRIFNDNLYGEFSAGYSQYRYGIESTRNPVNAFRLNFNIRQTSLQADFSYFPAEKHAISFGVSSIQYRLNPGSFLPNSSESLINPEELEAEHGLETAFYISDEFTVSPKLTLVGGLRYSIFNYLGPRSINSYAEGQPRGEFSRTETRQYDGGEIINTWHGPEARFSARYSLSNQTSVKLGYNSMRQYIHMLSNTTAIAPTDIWKLSDPNVRPQIGQQVSLGFYRNLRNGTIETSVEGYYKRIKHFLDFKSGAELIMNQAIETDIINTRGRAYGAELMVKKAAGKLNGWFSYTWSRTLLQQDDPIAGELINRGEWYPSNFDKPHDFTLVSNYRFSHRFSMSFNFTYSTGRPITLPVSQFNYGGSERVFYSDRNAFRIPDYYRADISMNIEGNHKVQKLAHSSWTFAIFNLTGRRNPYSVFFVAENGEINGYRLSIFGQPIPTVTYNFKF